MSITNYSELQTAITNWLFGRTDLSSRVPEFIQLAEGELRKDPRVRRLENHGALAVSAESTALPADYLALEALHHNGSAHYGPIEIVGLDTLSELRGRYGTSAGVPRYAAVVDGEVIVSPVPDQAYSLRLAYWQGITPLSASATTNWLLTSHPDLYLYASLLQAAPYLYEDERVGLWEGRVEKGLENLRLSTWHTQFGGGTTRRQFRPIG